MFHRAAQAGAALLLTLAVVPCFALPISADRPATLGAYTALLVKSAVATGYNVLVVKYPGGKFEKWGENEWREYTDGGQFNFEEQARGETTVMLFDPSRNVYIEINLADGEIRYGEAGQQFSFLYPITETLISDQSGQAAPGGETGDAAAAQRVDYTCEEGLPMSVLYEQVGDAGLATYTIDGSPEVLLRQVPSGSGATYTNGTDTIFNKGRQAVLETPSGLTRCNQN
jgi:membrane-bound inhibitor of C-type lysozyme